MSQRKVRLSELAYARSGDKGRNANIGIIALSDDDYRLLEKFLTEEVVQAFFQPMGVEETKRYSLPRLQAFNFVLKGVLGQGGSRSLRIDAQGKALGQALLELELSLPEEM